MIQVKIYYFEFVKKYLDKNQETSGLKKSDNALFRSKNSLDQKIAFRQGKVNQTFISFLQKRRKKIYLYLFIC